VSIIHAIKKMVSRSQPVWTGDYKSWDEASRLCTNYDDRTILGKVKNALLKVKNGEAAFERDSVLFSKPQYNWSFLASLLWSFTQASNKLTIIDFGGSLGSTYFQHRSWLEGFDYTWNIIEQPHYVREGKLHFENERLKFYNDVRDVPISGPSFLILSSVLAYLPTPYEWLTRLMQMKFDYVFIDRTPLIEGEDRLTIQHVPPEIYSASYPAWFFSRERFLEKIQQQYQIKSEFDCNEKSDFPSEFIGFFLALKK